MALTKLLVVDDNKQYLESLKRALQKDYETIPAANPAEARDALRLGCDIALLDLRLNDTDESNREGFELLREFRQERPDLPIVMMTAYGDMDIAIHAMTEGAADFLPKPVDLTKLRATLSNVLQRARLEQRVANLQQDYARIEPGELIGQTPAMESIRSLIQMVANDGYVTVLIQGETGTGKELVARAIHSTGWRSNEPFVPVVIAALSASLIESELFGHEAGAFTGANRRHLGYIEKAKGGVLFLDEINDLPQDVQVKLLRFLEERKFSRVGSTERIEVDVQIVAATNHNMEELVAQGKIRKDLFYRLKSMDIVIAPLRARLDDLSLLIHHFLDHFRRNGRTAITTISSEALQLLARYDWPGNVRELKTVLERAIIFANSRNHQQLEKVDISPESLHVSQPASSGHFRVTVDDNGVILDQHLARWELAYIEAALECTEGRKTETWKLLGLNDRYALLRRVTSIIKKYPHLLQEYALIRDLYGKG